MARAAAQQAEPAAQGGEAGTPAPERMRDQQRLAAYQLAEAVVPA
jgi:hypothetical protein